LSTYSPLSLLLPSLPAIPYHMAGPHRNRIANMTSPPTKNVHDSAALEQFFCAQRLDPHRLKRWRYLLYAESCAPQRLLSELPDEVRTRFQREFRWDWLQLVDRRDSQLDASSKLVLQTPDRLRLETVILRTAAGRTSLCLSSQIGCAMHCRFCATGRMGLVRNLDEGEMIAQLSLANELLRGEGRRVRNVVFMGMGEPLHNEAAVYAVLDKLLSPAYFSLASRRLLVSTVGVSEAMQRFARRFPTVGLAISLHSTDQAQREQLIPLARRYPLDELRNSLLAAQQIRQRPLMIEYLMLDGINDQDDDAGRLARYVQGLWVHINLIPYNPIDGGPPEYRPTPRERRDAFASRLRHRGHLVTIRYSQGSDIGAACGQLVQPSQPQLAQQV
jgi:23S rRNA (adenine2503-C2)-methyltransferase